MVNKIAFIHVPRCGGTSVRNALRMVYGDRGWFDDLPFPVRPDDYDCVAGHITYPQVQDMFDTSVVTLLRHPVDIEESWLNRLYTLRNSGCPLQAQFLAAVRLAERNVDSYVDLFVPFVRMPSYFCGPGIFNIEAALKVLFGLTYVGMYDLMLEFYSALSQLAGVTLPAQHINASQPQFKFTYAQRAAVAWKLREDVAVYEYIRSLRVTEMPLTIVST